MNTPHTIIAAAQTNSKRGDTAVSIKTHIRHIKEAAKITGTSILASTPYRDTLGLHIVGFFTRVSDRHQEFIEGKRAPYSES